jgi:hypothetical protein
MFVKFDVHHDQKIGDWLAAVDMKSGGNSNEIHTFLASSFARLDGEHMSMIGIN